MSKEKQIEELARICGSSCGECAQCENYRKGTLNGIDRCYLKYGEMIYNAGYRKQREWISVEERVPESDARVLVYMHENRMSYTRIDTDRMVQGEWVRWETCVTHWMPLPEPPKGEE